MMGAMMALRLIEIAAIRFASIPGTALGRGFRPECHHAFLDSLPGHDWPYQRPATRHTKLRNTGRLTVASVSSFSYDADFAKLGEASYACRLRSHCRMMGADDLRAICHGNYQQPAMISRLRFERYGHVFSP